MNTGTVSSSGDAMGQVFYSELAGHLFTAHGTERPDRISDTYFAAERQKTLDDSQDCPTHSINSSVDSRLPTLNHEEVVTVTEALRSQGIVLLDCRFPLRENSIVPPVASLGCLRLQPPSFALFQHEDPEDPSTFFMTSQERLACLKLMLLVAYDWWNMLSETFDEIYKTLSARPAYQLQDRTLLWPVQVFVLACSRGHENSLQHLLNFFAPTRMVGSPDVLETYKFPGFDGHNFLRCVARFGVERAGSAGNSKLDFPPRILQQLQHHFANAEGLTVSKEWGANPLAIALHHGDAKLSELFITWMGPSNVSKLVLSETDVYLLEAACKGNILTLAKCLVETGAYIRHESFYFGETYLHHVCGSPCGSDAEAGDFVKYLHEIGEDRWARNESDGHTPLHIAAASGKISVVRYILAQTRSRQQRHPNDGSGKTPLMLAMLAGNTGVMSEFSPWRPSLYGDKIKHVCEWYDAPMHDIHQYHGAVRLVPRYLSVHQLLYEKESRVSFAKSDKVPLRWIHLTANNVEWCEDLLIKWLLEGDGDCDIQSLEAAQQVFNQQHVSRTPQGRFFRPGVYCTQPSKGIFFVATPYMDFETSSNIKKKRKALQASASVSRSSQSTAFRFTTPDQQLYDTYISSGALHPRRTLDQYIYYNMDTSERDTDQVVQRYQRSQAKREHVRPDGDAPSMSQGASTKPLLEGEEETAIMVDQLWMWILGDGLIVTCGAERWNGLSGSQTIFQRLENSLLSLDHREDPRWTTAGNTALHFMTTCSGKFDRHARKSSNLQFMSMFEQSIGVIGAKDSDLLKKFSTAYTELKNNKGASRETFVKALNDLTTETDLLTELKDIRDELHIMNTILVDQQRVARSLLNLQMKMVRNYRTSLFSSIKVESARSEDQEEVFEPINTIIDQGLQNIAKLDAQAERLSGSLSELLQLKQAHYNAFELEFSRDLALDAAKQGRAVLVFTIVTIVFSPLSFVAAFFTMNLSVFPEQLSLSYVSQYVFGLGFAVAIPCILLAVSLGWWTSSWKRVRGAFDGPASGAAADLDTPEQDERLSASMESTQTTDQSSNWSPAGLGGVRSDETPRMTAGLTKRWRKWRTPEKIDLPR